MGMRKAFTPWEADFSRMASGDLFLSKVIHQAYVDVNEEGTEAAAATAAVAELPGPVHQTVEFTADHSFVFLIRDRPTKSVLFVGRVMDPRM